MTLITRLARLFQADMHAVLDTIEEPAPLLKQSIREMEAAVAADEKQIRSWEYEERELAVQCDRLGASINDLEAKCALCFKSGKDDLARSFIKRKLETQQTKQLLTEKRTATQEKIARLTHRLAEHQAQLLAMKQNAEVFLEDAVDSTFRESRWASVRDEEVEIAFLQEKQKWSES